ncbi:MAG: hypothetical protein AB1847_06130 [bacterium]
MAHIFFEKLENRQSTQALYGGAGLPAKNKPVTSEWGGSGWFEEHPVSVLEYAGPTPWTPPGGGRLSGFISAWWNTMLAYWEEWAFHQRLMYMIYPPEKK